MTEAENVLTAPSSEVAKVTATEQLPPPSPDDMKKLEPRGKFHDRAGITKNHSQKRPKHRRLLARQSRRANRH